MLFSVEQCAHQQVLTHCHARRCSSGLFVDADATSTVIGDPRSLCLSVFKGETWSISSVAACFLADFEADRTQCATESFCMKAFCSEHINEMEKSIGPEKGPSASMCCLHVKYKELWFGLLRSSAMVNVLYRVPVY